MNTLLSDKISFSSTIEPTTFIEEKNSKNGKVNFIKGYIDNICVGIYDKNMYPLIIAKDNEYLEIITTNKHIEIKYIIKKINGKILGIYSSNGKNMFLRKENQEIIIDSIQENSFAINILEKDKPTILYDVLNKKEIIKSTYLNTIISIDENYYLELQKNKIKAVYDKFNNSIIVKSDLGSLEFIKSTYSSIHTYIKELNSNGKCHKIYKRNLISYDEFYSNEKFDLSLEFFNSKDIVILGKINDLFKYVTFYCNNTDSFSYSKTLDLDNGEYFKLPKLNSYFSKKNNIVKLFVMFKDKCVKILNDRLEELLSIDYNKNSDITHYFEFDNNYIKEIKDNCCIAIYDLSGTLLIKTHSSNENIVTLKRDFTDLPIFFILRNNECIMIQKGNHYLGERTDITYKSWTSYDDEFIGGYIVKNGKNIGIFDFNLHTIVCFDSSDNNTTIEAIKYGIHDTVCEDRQDYPYKVKYLKVIYLVYDPKCSKIYNEKNELLLEADENSYFKPYGSDYLLLCTGVLCYKVYSLKDFEINNTLSTNSNTQFIFPYKCQNRTIIFQIIDLNLKRHIGLFVKKDYIFSSILNEYEEIFDFNNFLLAKYNDEKFAVIELPQYYQKSKFNTHLLYNTVESLKLNIEDKTFPYIYSSNLSDNTYSIYSIDKSGFEKIITSNSYIEPIYDDNNNIFFKTDDKVYNKVGNII